MLDIVKMELALTRVTETIVFLGPAQFFGNLLCALQGRYLLINSVGS